MKTSNVSKLAAPGLALLAVMLVLPMQEGATHADDADATNIHLISESAILAGLPAGAVFPFIDTTPNGIRRAHIAVTDSTADCAPGAAPPNNVQVLVGVAGGPLVSVMSEATNTGISTTEGQCVFHVTVRAGKEGIPVTVTDIVVLNGGKGRLTGINTITASAEVVRRNGPAGHAH